MAAALPWALAAAAWSAAPRAAPRGGLNSQLHAHQSQLSGMPRALGDTAVQLLQASCVGCRSPVPRMQDVLDQAAKSPSLRVGDNSEVNADVGRIGVLLLSVGSPSKPEDVEVPSGCHYLLKSCHFVLRGYCTACSVVAL
eukprot:6172132-Pleurochrysis_carterae.AAC.4